MTGLKDHHAAATGVLRLALPLPCLFAAGQIIGAPAETVALGGLSPNCQFAAMIVAHAEADDEGAQPLFVIRRRADGLTLGQRQNSTRDAAGRIHGVEPRVPGRPLADCQRVLRPASSGEPKRTTLCLLLCTKRPSCFGRIWFSTQGKLLILAGQTDRGGGMGEIPGKAGLVTLPASLAEWRQYAKASLPPRDLPNGEVLYADHPSAWRRNASRFDIMAGPP